MMRFFVAILIVASFCGCATTRPPPLSKSAELAPATQIGRTQHTTQPGESRTCIRLATPADLRPILVTRGDPADHFPICTLKLYNMASEPVIVGYTPNCVTVHCGSYEQQGPAVSFVHRREILDPQQSLDLEIPPASWTLFEAGERQLMIPGTLPTGSYETWADFKFEGSPAAEITTKHELFFAR